MGTDADLGTVVQFYDNHPINEDQILGALAAKGIAGDAITEAQLKDFDRTTTAASRRWRRWPGRPASAAASTCWISAAAWAAPRAILPTRSVAA